MSISTGWVKIAAMRNTFRICLLAVLILAFTGAASAQAKADQTTAAEQQFAALGDLALKNGKVIKDFRLGYRTLGTLDAQKSNALLFPTWLGGQTKDLLQFASPGNWLDTNKYFVVLIDAIGDGISTSPSNSHSQPLMEFPEFSIRDMVEAEHRFATEVLHLSHVHAVLGISMGGMQSFEWAVMYPDFMDDVVPIVGSPQSTSYDKLLWTLEIEAIELDPAWNGGKPSGPITKGFELAEEISDMNVTSPAQHVRTTNPNDFQAMMAKIDKQAPSSPGTAADFIRQRQAINGLDIPGELGETLEQAAAGVRAKMLIVSSPEDHMVNATPAIAFANSIGAPVVLLDSPCGHLSPSCISVGPVVAKFLADPTSVKSQTLQETPAK